MFSLEFDVRNSDFAPEFTDEDLEAILDNVKWQIVNKLGAYGDVKSPTGKTIGRWMFKMDD